MGAGEVTTVTVVNVFRPRASGRTTRSRVVRAVRAACRTPARTSRPGCLGRSPRSWPALPRRRLPPPRLTGASRRLARGEGASRRILPVGAPAGGRRASRASAGGKTRRVAGWRRSAAGAPDSPVGLPFRNEPAARPGGPPPGRRPDGLRERRTGRVRGRVLGLALGHVDSPDRCRPGSPTSPWPPAPTSRPGLQPGARAAESPPGGRASTARPDAFDLSKTPGATHPAGRRRRDAAAAGDRGGGGQGGPGRRDGSGGARRRGLPRREAGAGAGRARRRRGGRVERGRRRRARRGCGPAASGARRRRRGACSSWPSWSRRDPVGRCLARAKGLLTGISAAA